MNSGDRKRRRVLSDEERVLWSTVTKSIDPLWDSGNPEEIELADDVVPQSETAAVKPKSVAAGDENRPPPLAPLGRRMRARVARGRKAIDGRLDLHGLTQEEAHAALLRFLRNASTRDARLVLVITGKGGRRDGERGILKRQVPHWLSLPEFRAFVVGFEDAHIAHGGEGALYVQVRRNRHG